MKIVELNPFFLPYDGGIEKRIAAIASRLSKRHEVTVITSRLPGTPDKEQIAGANVIRLPSRFFGNYNPPWVISRDVEKTLVETGADIVDYHYRWSPSYNRAFFRYGGNRVVTFHNQFGEGTGMLGFASRINDSLYIRRSGMLPIMTISDFVRRQLLARGCRESSVEVVYNGIDMPESETADEGFALFIGRLVSTKGVDRAVRACIGSGVPLKVAGTGPLMKKLRTLAGGSGTVEFLGHVSEAEKEKLLSACSFFILPSVQEAFGIAALEAMAHGKAVVASNTGGLAEVIGETGILVDGGSESGLSDAVSDLWNDEEKRRQMGAMALQRARQFSWDSSVRNVEKFYLRAVER
ncbi:MAG: glycosyltransferase family 4 protein [Candidatus Thermoplasmatota archaeon]|nr:glycosyltransferase family 4 protein [Candidatus Thermoplasmatota archaeon]